MNTVSTDTDKKKRKKRGNQTTQLAPSTECKASGYNWGTYKSSFSNAKAEESAGEKSVPQNRRPKFKKVHTAPLHKDSQEENHKHNAVKDKENKTLTSTERKASGCNWGTYKSLFSKAKAEESAGEKSVSQNRCPKFKKVHTAPLHKDSQEENHKHNAVKDKANKTLTSTERKASGCNWGTYKSSVFKVKAEESAEEKSVPQNRCPKFKKVHTAPLHKDSQEENHKHNAVKNKENKTLTKHISMDCEMVGIGDGTESMVARVSIVNKYGNCVYDKYVKPREKIVDYRTAISGIRPEHLQDGESFSIVQKEVANILKDRILVGHALKHDLNVLYLSHPRRYWRDTSKYKPFRHISKGSTPSLKKLTHELLGREIQVGEHNSVEDARAAMQLYMLYKNKWESERKY